MSIERLTYKTLAIVTVAKVAGDTFGMAARLANAFGRGMDDLGDAFFVFEFDAAKRYENITGQDLGDAIGEPGRYAADKGEEITEAAEVEDDDGDE